MAVKLNDGQIKAVKDGLRKLHDLVEDYDKAEKCGVDCSEFREFHTELEKQLTAILAEFDDTPKAK